MKTSTVGRLPLLTIEQRAEIMRNLAKKRAIGEQIKKLDAEIRAKRLERNRLVIEWKAAPTHKSEARRAGVSTSAIFWAEKHEFKRLNPLDKQAQDQCAPAAP